jgi:transposase-like protein
MESDGSELCQAAPGEGTPSREDHRNGYRNRKLETQLGTLGLTAR